MLQRSFRLPASTRLLRPKTTFTPYFAVKIAPNDFGFNRYGFVVSKKIDKRAVYRNRLKRRFRAGVELIQKEVPQGYDVLFILKKEAVEQITESLHKEVKKILSALSH